MKIFDRGSLALSFALILFASACSKKPPVAPAPPPAPSQPAATAPAAPQRPQITFTIEPSSVERGQTAVMRWNVTNATGVSIDNGIGTVPATGTRNLNPTATMTYRLSATGPGGDASATATVTIVAPPPPPPPAPRAAPQATLESRLGDLKDALFDYDSNNIRDDARGVLTANAEALKKIFADFPNASILVEGHCDERGSAEYNLGLGDRRATAARDFLVQLGVPAAKLKTISYGKERPLCTESNEGCWQSNRRAHFSVGQ
ncbi:MAG TPA: OmpA family protein [Bryobacteraceae bacterium]|nr:OmpA family protein [Bryobacteraceae bacterium]